MMTHYHTTEHRYNTIQLRATSGKCTNDPKYTHPHLRDEADLGAERLEVERGDVLAVDQNLYGTGTESVKHGSGQSYDSPQDLLFGSGRQHALPGFGAGDLNALPQLAGLSSVRLKRSLLNGAANMSHARAF